MDRQPLIFMILTSNKSKYQHLFYAIIQQSLSYTPVQFLATSDGSSMQILQMLFSQLGLLQLQAVQIVGLAQVRNNELVADIVLFFIVGIHKDFSVE